MLVLSPGTVFWHRVSPRRAIGSNITVDRKYVTRSHVSLAPSNLSCRYVIVFSEAKETILVQPRDEPMLRVSGTKRSATVFCLKP